ncbi:MAG: type III-A CRISPR-associated RAMP protein Csm5 [Magnetococcales bacterium]|nr:type III-A CRISPR-associated RAMP protein Csm5 [Magnetococcales bacterium]
MGKPFMKQLNYVISTLSPILIGAGEDFIPVEYVVRDKYLYPFSVLSINDIINDQQRNRLREIASRDDSLSGLVEFYKELKELPYVSERMIPMTEFAYLHHKKQNGRIERMIYDHYSNQPILPGSSVKGSIRTAILNSLAEDKENIAPGEPERDLMNGAFENDPLTKLKIGDAHVALGWSGKTTCIMTRHSRHRKDGTETTVKDGRNFLAECLYPFQSRWMNGKITILDGFVFEDRFIDQCNKYYKSILDRQIDMLKAMKEPWWADHFAHRIYTAIENKSGILLRIGKHSGADTQSIQKIRRIRTKYNTKDPLSTTLCRISGGQLVPFGWVFVEFYPDGEELRITELQTTINSICHQININVDDWDRQCFDYNNYKKVLKDKIAFNRNELEQKRLQEQRKEEQRLADQAQADALEQERVARLAALSPNQRRIEELRQLIEKSSPQPFANTLWNKTKKVVDDARSSAWSAEEKNQLIALCERDLWKKINKGLDEKKKKALLDPLRETLS